MRDLLNGFSYSVRTQDQLKRGLAASVFNSDPDRYGISTRRGTFYITMPWMDLIWFTGDQTGAPEQNIVS